MSSIVAKMKLTVPAVDLEDKNVLCFKRDNPKSPTCITFDIQLKHKCTKIAAEMIMTYNISSSSFSVNYLPIPSRWEQKIVDIMTLN